MDIQTIVVALIGGGIVSFVQFLIQRHDSKKDKNKEILSAIEDLSAQMRAMDRKIDSVDQKVDERSAVEARVRILRFADELQEGRRHSKDSYDQCVGADITYYEDYCDEHPGFKNNQTQLTVEYIKKNYAERLEKHDFL